MVNCSFCSEGFLSFDTKYSCQCDPTVVVCRKCQRIPCHVCTLNMRQVKMQYCLNCSKQYNAERFFQSYCIECWTQAYKKATGKHLHVRYGAEVDKRQIYQLLRKYCFKCRKLIRNERIQSEPAGIIEIMPLENNLCRKCLEPKVEQKSSPPRNQAHSRNQQKQSEDRHIQSPNKRSQQLKKGLVTGFMMNDKGEYIKCVGCDMRLVDSSIKIDGDAYICKICNAYEQKVFKSIEQVVAKQKINQLKEKQPMKKQREEVKPIINRFQQNEAGASKKIQKPSNQHRQDPIIKQTKKIPMDVTIKFDDSLIQCSQCLILVENQSIIWEQAKNVPLCKGCFTRLTIQLQQSQKYSAKTHKKPTIVRQQKSPTQDNEKYRSPLKSNTKPEKPKTDQSISRLNKPDQPEVIDETIVRPLNKVRRTDTWDENIIMEPVEDHLRRKRQGQEGYAKVEIDEQREVHPVKQEEKPTEPVIVQDQQEVRRLKVKRFNTKIDQVILQTQDDYKKRINQEQLQAQKRTKHEQLQAEKAAKDQKQFRQQTGQQESQSYNHRKKPVDPQPSQAVRSAENHYRSPKKATQTMKLDETKYSAASQKSRLSEQQTEDSLSRRANASRLYKQEQNSRGGRVPKPSYQDQMAQQIKTNLAQKLRAQKSDPYYSKETTYNPKQQPRYHTNGYAYPEIGQKTPAYSRLSGDSRYQQFPNSFGRQYPAQEKSQNYRQTITNNYVNEQTRLGSSKTSGYGTSRYATSTSTVKNKASEEQQQLCFNCQEGIRKSQRQYRLNQKPICLDCYGEYNMKMQKSKLEKGFKL